MAKYKPIFRYFYKKMRPPRSPKRGLLKSLTHKNSLILFYIFQRLNQHFIYLSFLSLDLRFFKN
jgi:hypothetical protein